MPSNQAPICSNACGTVTSELSSAGKRINSAADDAAGLAVSTKLKAQISGLNQAQKNVQDGINAIAISEGDLPSSLTPGPYCSWCPRAKTCPSSAA